jgi:general secretion pathway protein D
MIPLYDRQAAGAAPSGIRSGIAALCAVLVASWTVTAGSLPASAAAREAGLPPRLHDALAAIAVLQYVQSQQLPNGHVRLLLQFSGPAPMRLVRSRLPETYALQFSGAVAAATVPPSITVNLGAVQSVSITPQAGGLDVLLLLSAAVVPTVTSGPGNLVIVDVPPPPPQPALNNPLQYAAPTPAPINEGGTITQVVRLRYADVSEVVGILAANANIAPGNAFSPQAPQLGVQEQPGFGFNGGLSGGLNGGFGQTFQPFQQYSPSGALPGEEQPLGQRVSDNIAVDRRLNAVILTGTREQLAPMLALIAQLDVPVQSVLLDAQVIEVNENSAKALGLDYDQTTASPLSRIFNTQAQILNGLPAQAVAGSLAIQSNIFALVSQGHARVLASPKILTQDGVAASILTGDSLPIRITTPVGVGGVGAVSSQVEYINVGVTLQILPRVTGNGGVDANVFSQVSSVTGFDSSGDPQISTRQAQTKVNLMEGQTLVIGGLLQEQDIRNLQKIPILGDIPIFGALFRFYTETKQNTNLVITVTPHVVPAPVSPAAGPSAGAVPR